MSITAMFQRRVPGMKSREKDNIPARTKLRDDSSMRRWLHILRNINHFKLSLGSQESYETDEHHQVDQIHPRLAAGPERSSVQISFPKTLTRSMNLFSTFHKDVSQTNYDFSTLFR